MIMSCDWKKCNFRNSFWNLLKIRVSLSKLSIQVSFMFDSTLFVRSSNNPPSLILYMESKLGCDIPTIHNLTLVDFQIKDISGMDLTLLNFKKH